jgi:hypothetical protein
MVQSPVGTLACNPHYFPDASVDFQSLRLVVVMAEFQCRSLACGSFVSFEWEAFGVRQVVSSFNRAGKFSIFRALGGHFQFQTLWEVVSVS